ncbi:reverse transcriptase domain-containing protein [Tanacetum coccineum]
MKEVHYHNWLSNPVMVKKHDVSWRMYVDFKDLNKACPKDSYPLPEIDWKVESLYGYPFKCFLDAYKGYRQIKMAKEEEEKMAFITSQGIFYGSRAGLILTDPKGKEFTYALRFRFDATNNEAEYEALIAGLRIMEQMGIKTFKQMWIQD